MAKKTKKKTSGFSESQLAHWLKGHNLDELEWTGQAKYVKCSCGQEWR